ncbi:MAG: hypothetical protein ACRCZF_09140, partial [Gemmataceae bacterium]
MNERLEVSVEPAVLPLGEAATLTVTLYGGLRPSAPPTVAEPERWQLTLLGPPTDSPNQITWQFRLEPWQAGPQQPLKLMPLILPGAPQPLETPALRLTVTVPADAKATLRPFAPWQWLPAADTGPPYGFLAAILISVLILGWFGRRRFRQQQRQQVHLFPRPPEDRFHQLESEYRQGTRTGRELLTGLCDLLRTELETRAGFPATCRTPAEFPPEWAALQNWLSECDAARFGLAEPSADQCQARLAEFLRWRDTLGELPKPI